MTKSLRKTLPLDFWRFCGHFMRHCKNGSKKSKALLQFLFNTLTKIHLNILEGPARKLENRMYSTDFIGLQTIAADSGQKTLKTIFFVWKSVFQLLLIFKKVVSIGVYRPVDIASSEYSTRLTDTRVTHVQRTMRSRGQESFAALHPRQSPRTCAYKRQRKRTESSTYGVHWRQQHNGLRPG